MNWLKRKKTLNAFFSKWRFFELSTDYLRNYWTDLNEILHSDLFGLLTHEYTTIRTKTEKKNFATWKFLKKKVIFDTFFQTSAKFFFLLIFDYRWYIRVWQTIIFKTYFEFFVSDSPILRLTMDSKVTFFFLNFSAIYKRHIID